MTNKITNNIKQIATAVKLYQVAEFPSMAGKKAMAFIDKNFRNQSYEGVPWKRRRGGPRNKGRAILMNRGILRRGNNFSTGNGTAIIYNNVPYAKAHNNGFNGSVNIKAHKRRLYKKVKLSSVATRRTRSKKVDVGSTTVKAHSRNMRLPRRQFMPTAQRPSPTLQRDLKRTVNLRMLKILKYGNA